MKCNPDLKLRGTRQLYPLGTRYIDRNGRPWTYFKQVKAEKESRNEM